MQAPFESFAARSSAHATAIPFDPSPTPPIPQAYRQYLRMKAERERIRRQVCKTLAQGMAADGIRRMRIPTSCLRVQCWWRGVRVRARLERYRDWLRRRAKWLQERERVRMALGKVYESQADVRARQAIVERRIYGRDEFEHSGWQPDYKVNIYIAEAAATF